MNGYFRISTTSTSTNLEIFAPTDGGIPVKTNEIVSYLTGKTIPYDAGSLGKAIDAAAVKDTTVTLNMAPCAPISEMSEITVSPDKMQATVRLYSASVGGINLDETDIRNDLTSKGVKFGIKDDVIADIIANPRYCEDIVIAEGKAPGESTDGYIEYLFNTDSRQRPTLLEDGSVDFFHLNVLQAVAQGQEVARLHPSERGEDGTAIDGSFVRSREPKDVLFKYGANLHISENGASLISDVDGNVTLVNGQVFVNSSLTFDEVSTSTGNIEFEGSVVINGNIDTNFEVRVKGDVTVNGVIEGAYVEAGGNIIVARGVNGMGKAVLKAGGNIIAKYLENVTATAGGYISAEAVMHSDISAGGDILIDGRKGVLSGGHAAAGGMVEVKNLGSEMANDTIVEVGMSPRIKKEIMDLRNKAAEKQKTLDQVMPVLNNMAMKIKSGVALTDDQKKYVSQLMAVQKSTDEELASIMVKLAELENNFNVDTPAEVKVKGTVYPGARVCISDVSMSVKTPAKYCKFVKLRGDVKLTSYE
ncbi:MAG: DUF342 domain-containing protein [Lachnospiraceae bacterium]|nr:DUF342 domain-containing protein [Lachnospiraceae bacterium]